MAAHNSILVRINDIIGDDVTDVIGYKDLINSAFNYIADMIPPVSELWRGYRTDSGNTTDVNLLDASSYKIISVTRTDASDGIDRLCSEVSLDNFRRGEDTSSIYYSQKNSRNPIYTFDEGGDIIIRPTGGSPKIFYFRYLVGTDDIESVTDFTTIPFPEQAGFVAILKACSNIMQAKISQAVQDEEDQELLNLLNAQTASIKGMLQEEMQRLSLPLNMVGDEA